LRDAVFLVVVCGVTLVLQTTSLAYLLPAGWKPDLMLVVVGWAGLRATYSIGVAVAFLAGLAVDLMSGAPFGLFALVYCLVFFGCAYAHTVFPLDDYVGWAITMFAAALLSALAVLAARRLQGPVSFGLPVVAWALLKSLTTAAAALVIFPCMDALWVGYSKIVGAR